MRTRSAVLPLCLSFYCFVTILSAENADTCKVTLSVPSKPDLSHVWDATVEVERSTSEDKVYVLSRLEGSKGPWRVWTSKTKTFQIHLQEPGLRFFSIRAVVVRGTLPEVEVEGSAKFQCEDTKTVPNSGNDRGRSGRP
jgi:hypothetical protein